MPKDGAAEDDINLSLDFRCILLRKLVVVIMETKRAAFPLRFVDNFYPIS